MKKILLFALAMVTAATSAFAEATGDGTLANPYNAEAATAAAEKLEAGKTSDVDVYIKGKVSTISFAFKVGGTGSFSISDDGTTNNEFLCYSVFYLDNQRFLKNNVAVKQGDDVIVCGKLMKYSDKSGKITLETASKKAYIYSLNGNTKSAAINPADYTTVTVGKNFIENSGFETFENKLFTGWKSETTASSAMLSQETSDVHAGASAVKVAGATSNKRLASIEYYLPVGTYTMSFYVKGAGKIKAGYADWCDISDNNYNYSDYFTTTDDWTLFTREFEITSPIVANFVVMNPGKEGAKLIDDFSVVQTSLTTGIKTATIATPVKAIYSIDGRRLAAPVKGLNIINGKKVLVK